MSNEALTNEAVLGATTPCEAIVLDVSDVVKLEQAIAAAGTSLATLMERAGAAIASEVRQHLSTSGFPWLVDGECGGSDSSWPAGNEPVSGGSAGDGPSRPRVVVLAGTGNNGGDGWVAANLLAQYGCEVNLVTPKTADSITAEPAHTEACAVMESMPETLTVHVDPADDEVRGLLERADVVIDALLGTGFSGATVREPMATWISLMKETTAFIVAADVPSGVSAQTGTAATPCVIADMTVTMIVAKPGLFAEVAAFYVGTLVVDNLGITDIEARIRDDLGIGKIQKHILPRCDAQCSPTMQNALLARLREEKTNGIKGGIYHKLQVEFTYNSNHIEGSRLSLDQTRFIFETSSIGLENETIPVNDIIEAVNHFRCVDYVIDTVEEPLSSSMIKELHVLLKQGTTDSDSDWFAVGDYKKLPNEVGGRITSRPESVAADMDDLLLQYDPSRFHTLEEVIDFHVRFERIHPFQDGNGRVGRLIMLKECLQSGIVPFVISDDVKLYYYRGLSSWDEEPGYLTDTCLLAQDRFKQWLEYFRISYE